MPTELPFNLYWLRDQNIASVREAVALNNPKLSEKVADIQAELYITHAFHLAKRETSKAARRSFTVVSSACAAVAASSGTHAFYSGSWLPVIPAVIFAGLSITFARFSMEYSNVVDWNMNQGVTDNGYSLSPDGHEDKYAYRLAQDRIKAFVVSAKKRAATARNG